MDLSQLKFLPTHEWVRVDAEMATVGISRFAVDQLTDLIHIDLPAVGATLTHGKTFGEVESVKAVSDLYAPVGGEVVEVNPAVVADVQVLARDPYDAGWLVKVRLHDPKAATTGLLDHDAYQRQVADSSH